jgi:hypothetical protein
VIVLVALSAAMALPDLDAMRVNVGKCDRKSVSQVFSDEPQRRAAFLVESVREQRDIASSRILLAERRRKLREGPDSSDSAEAIAVAANDLEDRQQALNDRRALDTTYREALDFLRQHYLNSCAQGLTNVANK